MKKSRLNIITPPYKSSVYTERKKNGVFLYSGKSFKFKSLVVAKTFMAKASKFTNKRAYDANEQILLTPFYYF